MAVLARLILSVLLWGQVCHGLYVSDMYPFGEAYSDTKLSTEYDEDISSAEIKLGTNVKFFSREYKSIFVRIFFFYNFSPSNNFHPFHDKNCQIRKIEFFSQIPIL